MDRSRVIARLKETEPALKAHAVGGLFLFGSHARGEARPDSDIDVFIDKMPGRRFGLRELMGSYRILHEAFPGVEVGFGTRGGLSRRIATEVEREAIRIF